MGSLSTQFISLLIDEYRELPALWEIESDAYKNKSLKARDYETLLNSMMDIDPTLTMDDLKKKIANVRSCYRRELKKISDSIKSGAEGDEIYKPTLWYFKQIDFLRDQEHRPKSQISVNVSSSSASQAAVQDVDSVKEKKPNRTLSKLRLRLKQKRTEQLRRQTLMNRLLKKKQQTESAKPPPPPPQQPTQPQISQKQRVEKDEAETFSETWSILFRKLSNDQKLYGKRCIDEVLYQGQLGYLTANTYRSIETISRRSEDSEKSMQMPIEEDSIDRKMHPSDDFIDDIDEFTMLS